MSNTEFNEAEFERVLTEYIAEIKRLRELVYMLEDRAFPSVRLPAWFFEGEEKIPA